MMQGGNFWNGALAGFLEHLGGFVGGEILGKSTVSSIALGSLSGGIGAELTGRNFWQGAVTGGIVAGLNGVMHDGDGSDSYEQEDPPTKAQPKPGEFVSPQMEMNYKINEFCLDAVGFVRGAAELSAVKWGSFTTGLKGLFSSGSAAKIEQGGYSITKTVANNLASRPYINSPSTIKNIMKFGTSAADKFFKGGVNYRATGTFRGNQGVWELGINPHYHPKV
jgi:hypothetical protein